MSTTSSVAVITGASRGVGELPVAEFRRRAAAGSPG